MADQDKLTGGSDFNAFYESCEHRDDKFCSNGECPHFTECMNQRYKTVDEIFESLPGVFVEPNQGGFDF